MLLKLMDITLRFTAEQDARQLVQTALGPDGQDCEHLKFWRMA